MWLLQIIIFCYCIFVALRLVQLQTYKVFPDVLHIQKPTEYQSTHLQPIVLYDPSFQISKPQSTDKVILHNQQFSFSSFPKEPCFLYKANLLNLVYPDLPFTYGEKILLPPQNYVSVISGNHITTIQKNFHNYQWLLTVEGYSTTYLLNPEISDIKDYKSQGIKIILQPKTFLSIPPHWSYIQEISDKLIQYHYEIDDIFTFVPNWIKKNVYHK
jgi:hypothetical protein